MFSMPMAPDEITQDELMDNFPVCILIYMHISKYKYLQIYISIYHKHIYLLTPLNSLFFIQDDDTLTKWFNGEKAPWPPQPTLRYINMHILIFTYIYVYISIHTYL
jgi:hypothetical protein